MKKKGNCFAIVLCCFFALWGNSSLAQNFPVYTHFYQNPYLYNPAEAGVFRAPVVFFDHRQQWRGIEGAPVTSTVNFHSPIGTTKASVGFRLSSFNRGLLNTTDILATYGYGIYLEEGASIRFALSAGIISNGLDFTQIDNPDDPAVVNFLDNNLQPVANFGIKYTSNGLNFGVTLPQLFAPSFTNTTNFESTEVSPFDNALVMLYYKKKVEGSFKRKRGRGRRRRFTRTVKTETAYAPLELYMLYRYSAFGNSQFEALGKLNVSSNFFVGVSYRQEFGISGLLGINYDKFTFAYGYEPSSNQVSSLLDGTHEIQLGYRIGKVRDPKISKPVLRSKLTTTQPEEHKARFLKDDDDLKAEHTNTDKKKSKKFLVVIKTFRDFNAADEYKARIREEGYNAQIFYNEKGKIFYVHLFETDKSKEAKQEKNNLAEIRKFRSARVVIVED
ncbi:MAG: PorP/SprF family type IX secretion system membrane protein [Bacteroidota bacterium]